MCAEVLGRVLPSYQQALILALVLVAISVVNLSVRPMREHLPMHMGFISQSCLIATIIGGLIYERATSYSAKANTKVSWESRQLVRVPEHSNTYVHTACGACCKAVW